MNIQFEITNNEDIQYLTNFHDDKREEILYEIDLGKNSSDYLITDKNANNLDLIIK